MKDLQQVINTIKIINNTDRSICFTHNDNNTFTIQLAEETTYYLDERDDRIISLEPNDWINIKSATT